MLLTLFVVPLHSPLLSWNLGAFQTGGIFYLLWKQQELWHGNGGPARTLKGTEWHMHKVGSQGCLHAKGVTSMSRNHPNYLWLVSQLILMVEVPHLPFVKLFFPYYSAFYSTI